MAIRNKKKVAAALGQRIRAVRTKKGISLKHFEVKENAIDRHSLSEIEHGKKVPNFYTLYRIAWVLGVPVEDLVSKL